MKTLLIVATSLEIKSLLKGVKRKRSEFYTINSALDVLITGVGSFQTLYHLTTHLQNHAYDFLINIGICGSYSSLLSNGEIIEVRKDTFADFGIDDNSNFITAFDRNLIQKNAFPFRDGWLKNPDCFDKTLQQVTGITVQTGSGSEALISMHRKVFDPDVESMESAAFFYVALQQNIPFASIRSISNPVEPRNKNNWNIHLAIKNLHTYLQNKLIDG